jgi:hypothetical protein
MYNRRHYLPIKLTVSSFASYSNVTSTVLSNTQAPQKLASTVVSTSTFFSDSLSSTPRPSLSAGQQVNADTAVVVEPIQRTVVTHVIPAITFLNPKGEPVATQDAETILSTSFITPSPAPPLPSSAIATLIATPASPIPSLAVSSSHSKASSLSLSSSIGLPSSSQAGVASGPISRTSIPVFTYSPEETQANTPIASPSPIGTGNLSTGNSTSLPGFNHPGLPPRSTALTSAFLSSAVPPSPSASQSAIQASSLIAPSGSGRPATNATRPSSDTVRPTVAPNLTSSVSRVVIIKTEYTTVYPSSLAVATSSAAALGSSTSTGGSELVAGSTSAQIQPSLASSPNSSPATFSPTPLAPPPVVIITQYTTVVPSPTKEPEISTVPGTLVPIPAPSPPASSTGAQLPSSAAASSSPADPPSAQPTFSSRAPEVPVQSSSAVAPTLPPQVSSSTTSTLQPLPIPSASSVAPSPTSDGPLIITPIAPGQLFTLTVTTTEKETVTETATISVTVTA